MPVVERERARGRRPATPTSAVRHGAPSRRSPTSARRTATASTVIRSPRAGRTTGSTTWSPTVVRPNPSKCWPGRTGTGRTALPAGTPGHKHLLRVHPLMPLPPLRVERPALAEAPRHGPRREHGQRVRRTARISSKSLTTRSPGRGEEARGRSPAPASCRPWRRRRHPARMRACAEHRVPALAVRNGVAVRAVEPPGGCSTSPVSPPRDRAPAVSRSRRCPRRPDAPRRRSPRRSHPRPLRPPPLTASSPSRRRGRHPHSRREGRRRRGRGQRASARRQHAVLRLPTGAMDRVGARVLARFRRRSPRPMGDPPREPQRLGGSAGAGRRARDGHRGGGVGAPARVHGERAGARAGAEPAADLSPSGWSTRRGDQAPSYVVRPCPAGHQRAVGDALPSAGPARRRGGPQARNATGGRARGVQQL